MFLLRSARSIRKQSTARAAGLNAPDGLATPLLRLPRLVLSGVHKFHDLARVLWGQES
jgi:hypothetical protein